MFSTLFISIRAHLHLCRRMVSSTTRIVTKANLPSAAYNPEVVENKYEDWESNGLFKAQNYSSKPNFSVVLPPPNVTGKLHLGHALTCAIQDVVVRRKRSMGFNTLWLPGTDHAGIATQNVVEKYLKSVQDLDRHSVGRERFNKEVWKWQALHGDTITKQLRRLGCSLDWSRETFTMDPKHSHAVSTAFIRLFDKGLIYRKKALVNWCNKLQSTVSDIEVENFAVEKPTDIFLDGYERPVKFGLLYHFAYKVYGSDEQVVVATTMPETMLGDTAIAVHPDDTRYSHLRNRQAIHPFTGQHIPIITDSFVDMSFGTGAVKITPAHSKIDYEIARDHQLPMTQVIDENGRMINSGEFNGLQQYECRHKVIEQLRKVNALKEMVAHSMSVPICSRSGDIITHIPKEQWFLSCNKLNERVIEMIEHGKLTVQPAKFIKNWLSWIGDDRDWCISRQLWWGHQIPAYRCVNRLFKDASVWVAAKDEISAKTAASAHLKAPVDYIDAERDTDVLDTWFSSGIYPFACLGWPDKVHEQDYREFYPLSLLATGHDILGFWVHRMAILGIELTGKLPFDSVLLHGVICDSRGAKMSKSRGNVIDPIDVIDGITMEDLRAKTENMHSTGVLTKREMEKALEYHKANFSRTEGIPRCGVDALRFTLLTSDVKSNFVNFDVHMCFANKLFCNKMWQSVKYAQICFDKLKPLDRELCADDLTYFDRWIMSRLADMVKRVNESIDQFDFHLATKSLRGFIYNEFCDYYVEATKPGFEESDPSVGYAHAHTLAAVLNTSLRCLHPFMIYVTEELIPKIPDFERNAIVNFDDLKKPYLDFPQYKDFKMWKNDDFERNVEKVLSTISLVREMKGLYGISNKIRPMLTVESKDGMLRSELEHNKRVLLNLTRCCDVRFGDTTGSSSHRARGILDSDTQVALELVGDDVETLLSQARAKLQKKMNKIRESLTKIEDERSDSPKVTAKKEELKKLERLII